MFCALDTFVHGVGVGRVDVHAFFGQRRCIPDGDGLKFWVLGPVFFEDEEDVLGFAEGENGHEDTASSG